MHYDRNHRWSVDAANHWYDEQPWFVGANFVPRTAINQLEMWQYDSFDPDTIDEELGWAAAIGFNCMRVYLHDLLWKEDAEGFLNRIEQYLTIADQHEIKTLFVLFDSVWDPRPELGPQREPKPGVHNSGWLQGPHIDVLKDPSRHVEVEPYVTGLLNRFKHDQRILAWDLLNEPGNRILAYRKHDPETKAQLCIPFLNSVFDWAQSVRPDQPLTAGVWDEPGKHQDPVRPLDQLMLDRSDIITFHMYTPLDETMTAVDWLRAAGRPILCTEYMARSEGSTFQAILPFFKEQRIGAINWGLVSGRSQAIYPWKSWAKPFDHEPDPWFHDVFRKDGSPYDSNESALIQSLTSSGDQ